MRLKNLEIKGFKSFADKTVIHFNDNLTGIVGPNGCGKSNTVDAIRWVLGEQKSKALRLAKMDNIIFNGTKKRKPSGRAEVSLTFENTRNLLPTEFTTVTVTRTIYRTGESEYRLNNVRCRLKDISNLFMDTGISSDSYAIIELKMIDEILNDKDNSRRKLFEQAAGISKYKVRKRETLNKLKATDADLARVEDLLFEIEANLKTLERQAKRTERYYKLKDKYKELSIELALHHLAHHKVAFQELKTREQQESDQKLQVEAAIAQLEANLAQQKTTVIDKEKALAAFQKQLNEHIAHLQSEENQKNLLAQNIHFLKEKKRNLSRQIDVAQQFIQNLQHEIEHLAQQQKGEEGILTTVSAQLDNLKEELSSVQAKHDEHKTQLEDMRSSYRNVERAAYDVEKKMAIHQAKKENINREISDTKIRFQSQKAEVEEMQENLNNLEKEQKTHADKLEELTAKRDTLEKQIEEQSQQIEKSRQQQQQLNRELDAKRNEYQLTKSLVDSMEGFPDSIKFLKKNKQWDSEAPLLIDIINCEEDYKIAIEHFLKPYLNNYVVNNVDEAHAAVGLLHNARKGKANFFILSELGTEIPTATPPLDGAIPALSIVNVADIYQPLTKRLLHDVYIVADDESLDARVLQNGYTFISKSGKTIRQKAVLGGGSIGAYEGKRIGKRQYLKELDKKIIQLDVSSKEINETVKTQQQQLRIWQKELKENKQWLIRQQGLVNKLNNRIVSFRSKIENSKAYMGDFESKTDGLKETIANLNKEIDELNIQLAELQQEKKERSAAFEQKEKDFTQLSGELGQLRQSFNQQNIEFHKQQNRINGIRQNQEFKQKQLLDNQEQITKNQATLEATKTELSTAQTQLQEAENKLLALYEAKTKQEKELAELETIYYQARGEVDATEKTLRQTNKQKENTDALIQQIKEQINQLKIQLLSLKERLSIEFKVNIDDLLQQEPSEEYTKEELEELVGKLKGKTDRFGNINPMAIEAYQEMKKRYDFIVEQRDDLLKAKEALLETIGEIEGTATEKFMDAFNRVRENFVDVFRSLFTSEDTCDLLLLQADNPLESAIDIIAKPKGKRPQSINQLSGGEKSLTALALVFSLYLLKPAPFCILDEVDAPLDDANVGKFTRIIRKFSEQSQFILVTHNKNTMAAVDVIYGVTMHEQGVSSVVPVDFRDLEL